MRPKSNIPLLSSLVFALVFIMHGLRLIYGWDLIIGGVMLPLWLSGLGVILAGLLAGANWALHRHGSR